MDHGSSIPGNTNCKTDDSSATRYTPLLALECFANFEDTF